MVKCSNCPVMLLLYVLMGQLLHMIHGFNHIFTSDNLELAPDNLTDLALGSTKDVNVQFAIDARSFPKNYTRAAIFGESRTNLTICYEVENPTVAWIDQNQCSQIPVDDAHIYEEKIDGNQPKHIYLVNSSFSIKGVFLGRTNVAVTVWYNKENKNGAVTSSLASKRKLRMSVIRDNFTLQYIFLGTLISLMMVAYILMGAQLNLKVVAEVLRRPLAPVIGLSCQYMFMPLISFTVASLVLMPCGMNSLALGLFTTGCSPGGGASNGYTVLLDGNLDLSVTMTFFSTVLAMFLMPIWMFLLGHQFLDQSPLDNVEIRIPYRNICTSLFGLVVPLFIGIVIRHFCTNFAARANRILRPLLLVTIVFICSFGSYANSYMFRLMSLRVLLAGMCLPALGFLFGCVTAWLFRQPLPNIKAIAVETGIQNTGISILLLNMSFGQPEGDLAAVVPVVVALFTPPPLLLALLVHYILKYREKRTENKRKEVENGGEMDKNGNNLVATLHQADSTKPLYPLDVDEKSMA